MDSKYAAPDVMLDMAQMRKISTDFMPLWRKREIIAGILRGALFYQLAGFRRLPIIHKHVKVRADNGVVNVGHFSEIHERVVLSAIGEKGGQQARLSIGEYTSIWFGTVLSARHKIEIGRQCAISWNCTIIDNDMHEILYNGDDAPAKKSNDVKIGDHVWLGAAAVVLKGVSIGENSVVAAGAIVLDDVPSNTLVAGVPARPIRSIAGWR